MEKQIEITKGQLATLLWIDALDKFEDGVNISLRDKYYNFIENNSVIEGMESTEFDNYKEMLVAYGLLKETADKLEFTKKGKELVKVVVNADKENELEHIQLEKKSFPSYADIKKFIDDNANVIEIAIAVTSLLVTIIG